MNDYTPSDAAKAYADAEYPNLNWGAYSVVKPASAASFDAGIAHERESRKPRTITTASELDALPQRTVVIGGSGWAWQKRLDNYWYGEDVARTSSAIATNYGPFTLLVPASESAPEPVRLTDADDERIKPGARVRMVVEYVVDEEGSGVYRYPVQLPITERRSDAAVGVGEWNPAIVLDVIRAAGYDVVKRAVSGADS